LDSEPAGYEPSNTHVGSYSPWLSVLNEFGYSESQRLGFLREQGVDPIDIASTHISVGCDLNQPFFLDEALGQMSTPDEKPYPAMRGIEEEWTTYRAKLNADRFRAMTDRLVDVSVPILMMPRSVAVHTSPRLGLYLVPWIPGEPIPTYDPQSQAFVSNWVYTFNEESSPVAIHDLGMWLKSAKMSVAVDTSSVKPEKLDSLLGKWFPRVHSQP